MTATQRRIYLDYNASAPLLPQARKALVAALDLTGNPSSVHGEGRAAHALLERSRQEIARLVDAKPGGVVFTSGASEAAATVLSPVWIEDGAALCVTHLAVLDTDHPSIREGGRFEPDAVTRLPVDADGLIAWPALEDWLAGLPDGSRAMLALSWANSETGVVQPIERIAEKLAGRKVILVLDAVQVAGRLPIDLAAVDADALILSGHKIGAAKGVGALVLRSDRLRPAPLLTGGGQEKRRRAGTEALPLIAAFGAAAATIAERLTDVGGALLERRHRLEHALLELSPDLAIIGRRAPRLPNTVAFACAGMRAETVQIGLDLAGFAISSGSACSSGKVGPSHVLQAMRAAGADLDPIRGAIRISFGYETPAEDLSAVVMALAPFIPHARKDRAGRVAA